ncbi:MAG: hypothetical protein NTV06_06940, partial [candidate division Zixibacteria bacterium]|nr:hypothetical protein [candidate division Zixibacteria bacterium]
LISAGMVLLILSLIAAYKLGNPYLVTLSVISLLSFIGAFFSLGTPLVLFACKLPILLFSLLAGYFYLSYLIFILALIILTRLYYRRRFHITYPRLT